MAPFWHVVCGPIGTPIERHYCAKCVKVVFPAAFPEKPAEG